MRMFALRTEHHVQQKEVAAVLGISPSAYCDRENGHVIPSALEVVKLAEYYGVGLDEFFRGGQPVLNMQDHSSNGYNVIHSQTVNGLSDELMQRFIDVMATNAAALEKLATVLSSKG